jgi:hypothetical protein
VFWCMASIIFAVAAETARVAINATGVKSIALLESVVIEGSSLHGPCKKLRAASLAR